MNEEIVTRIQTVMEHYDLTVSALADNIGVQRSSVSHLLSGRNKPSLDFVMKLVKTYPEVNLYWLLQGKGSFPENLEEDAPTLKLGSEEADEKAHQRKTAAGDEKPLSPLDGPIKIVLFYPDGTFESFDIKK